MSNINIKTVVVVVGIIAAIALGIFLSISKRKILSGKTEGVIVNTRYDYNERESGSNNRRRTETERILRTLFSYRVGGAKFQNTSEQRATAAVNHIAGAKGTVCYDPKNPQFSEFDLGDYVCG